MQNVCKLEVVGEFPPSVKCYAFASSPSRVEPMLAFPLRGCGCPVDTSAKQKHRPNRQVRLSCLRSRLRERFSVQKNYLSLRQNQRFCHLPRQREALQSQRGSDILHFALCILHSTFNNNLQIVCINSAF